MIESPTVLRAAASVSRAAPLGGHLWHTVEALTFLVTSLGGIAIAELIQARRRHAAVTANRRSAPGLNRLITAPREFQQSSHVGVIGGTSGVALMPTRVAAQPQPIPVWPTPVAPTRSALLPLVAVAGAAAAAVHFVVMPEHFEEATMYGAFFAIAATSQIIYSLLLLLRPSRPLVATGAIGNLAIVALWFVTRTTGIPLGPGAGHIEAVGGLDVLATIFEVATAVGAVLLLSQRRPLRQAIRPSSWSPVVLALVPVVVGAIAVTTYLSPPS
jgi:hypothetical protein